MANYGGAASGALSGAAAGSMLGPWGTAAGAVIGGLGGLMGGDGGAGQQQQIEADNLQNAQNEQQYSHGLNAEALRRAVAGSVDAQGSSIRYDPATNSWVSALGAQPAAQQSQLNSANTLNNSVAVPQAVQNNAASSIMASLARRGMSGALNNLQSYTPTTDAAMRGALQDASTRANQISQAPIIQDTLRQFARTGTAAGPVLAQMERANSDSLSQEMANNVIKAQTGAADVNTANRQSLMAPISALMQAGTPNQQNTSPSYTQGPASELAAQVNGRAAASASPATSGAAYNAYGTSAHNTAAQGASGVAMNSPVPGYLASANQSIQTLAKSGSDGSSPWGNIGDQVNRYFNGTQGTQVQNTGGGVYGPVLPNAKYDSSPDYTNF